MIEIASYLRLPNGQFMPVSEVAQPPSDSRYVEGAIDLSIDGRPILDKALWDYVDQLWAYLSDMVLALRQKGESSTYFPDQPIKLSFRRHGRGRVLVTLAMDGETRTASIDEGELIEALRVHGNSFFEAMAELLPANRDGYADAATRLNAE